MKRRLGTCKKCGGAVRVEQLFRLVKGRGQGIAHEHCPPKLVLVKS
jgi:hypothetical protein